MSERRCPTCGTTWTGGPGLPGVCPECGAGGLKPEQVERLAETLLNHLATDMVRCECGEPHSNSGVVLTNHRAQALAPVVARMLAEAWEQGYGDGHDDEANARYDIGANPYREVTE